MDWLLKVAAVLFCLACVLNLIQLLLLRLLGRQGLDQEAIRSRLRLLYAASWHSLMTPAMLLLLLLSPRTGANPRTREAPSNEPLQGDGPKPVAPERPSS